MTQSNIDSKVIVVFGGAGYIGSSLVPMLLEAGHKVRVYDNFLFGKDGVSNLSSKNLEIIEGDLCDVRNVSHAISGTDAVVLLSAIVGHRVDDNGCKDTRTVNFLSTTVALDAAIEHGVSKFVFASTNSIYGLQSGVMYETGIPEPVSLYSRLKLRMEERVINARTRWFHPVALRIATCHGYSPRMRFDLVLNGMVRDAICQKIITVESPEKMRSLVHVRDAAQSIVTCLNAHPNMVSGEVFNVGNTEQNMQLLQLANRVKAVTSDTQVRLLDKEPDLITYRLSCSKIEKLLGFKANISLEESIAEIKDHLDKGEFFDPYSWKYNNT